MRIRHCVIPAAGKGKRIADLPLTGIYPKPMLPILNKPILEYTVESAKKFGVEAIHIVVGHRKEIIKEYFQEGKEWGVEISYVEQPTPTGIGSALNLVSGCVNEPFLVILGDDFTIADSYEDLVSTFFKHKAWVVEGVVFEENTEALKRTCCVRLNPEGRIEEIVEKPARPTSRIRGIGIYIFDPIVFDFIAKTPVSKRRNEVELTDTIALMAKEGRAFGCHIDGININVNTLEDFIIATQALLKHNMLRTRHQGNPLEQEPGETSISKHHTAEL